MIVKKENSFLNAYDFEELETDDFSAVLSGLNVIEGQDNNRDDFFSLSGAGAYLIND